MGVKVTQAKKIWFFTESWGANKGLGEAPKSCTRKEHESATNSIAKRGQGAIAPCRVKGQRPLWGLGQRPNSSTGDQYAKRAQQRCRQRSVPASNSALPQERPQAALPTTCILSRQMGATDLPPKTPNAEHSIHSCIPALFVKQTYSITIQTYVVPSAIVYSRMLLAG